jgi:hypothetical protein
MVNKIILVSLAIAVLLYSPSPVMADRIGGQSALLSISNQKNNKSDSAQNEVNYSLKRKVIRKVLQKYNSPLVESTDAFIDACQKYNLDCYLLPSIAGLESYFGHQLMPGSHNPFGWGRGLIYFTSWEEGIHTVGSGLRENYINKGATTVEEIGAIYCEGNTWAGKVRSIMKTFEKEEQNHELYFHNNTVEL